MPTQGASSIAKHGHCATATIASNTRYYYHARHSPAAAIHNYYFYVRMAR
jgi:hypothetical protein